jgi:hypothetical protein
MRVAAITALVLAVAPAVFAKSVVVSFKKGTSQSVVDEAKTKYKEAGGRITHEFHLINGFAAEVPDEGIASVSSWGEEHDMLVEDDKQMGTQ